MLTTKSLHQRAVYAAHNGIRGGPEKTLGHVLAKAFRASEQLDLSSGDLPKFLSQRPYWEIESAVRSFHPDFMAYDHPGYTRAQRAIMRHLGGVVSEHKLENERIRAQVIPAISPFMVPLIRAFSAVLNESQPDNPIFVITPPIHPNWITAIAEVYGYGPIVTIKRDARGHPDLEDAQRVFRSLKRPFILIITPDENPSGVCTPNSIYHNREGTGLLDLTRNVPFWGGVIFDAIYSDFAWGQNADKRNELRESAEELGIRMVLLHSLSKIYMMPGLRIGGAYYAGPMDDIGTKLCYLWLALANNNIKNGISTPALEALTIAYSGDEKIERQRKEILRTVSLRVVENEAYIRRAGMPHVFPEAEVETAFYGFHKMNGSEPIDSIPWYDPIYRQTLIDVIEQRLTEGQYFENLETLAIWKNFRSFVGLHGISSSRAFAIELAMNGVMVLPHDPFYPRFVDDQYTHFTGVPRTAEGEEAVAIRLILAHTMEATERTVTVIRELWKDGIAAMAAKKRPNDILRERYELGR